ncbi:hypothetical protein [Polyangium sp. 15x6]|uniref:hypothetical protein n=1 Tax=Polyangium sp. 15x6 TaxID=3042687 RepID=UPI00249B9EF6|nr:hypothetical protein [Polyangium sp. 15x6]MDI3291354.1 hypothetical protein [Polyangium sp. 15x6]
MNTRRAMTTGMMGSMAALGCVFALGCVADMGEVGEVPAEEAAPLPLMESEAATPVSVLKLRNGNELRFYSAPKEGTAVLEVGNVNNGPSVTQRPELRDASPQEIFWAVSEPGTPVPEGLTRQPLTSATSAMPRDRMQGWLVETMGASLTTPEQCTSDVLFDEAYCDEPAPYDSHKCFFNRSGDTIWNSGRASSYKVGLCVQEGTVSDQLTYTDHNPLGACGFAFPEAIAWTFTISAGGWINWVWSAGPGDWWRTYTHATTQASGDIFDHGQRWNYEPNCL